MVLPLGESARKTIYFFERNVASYTWRARDIDQPTYGGSVAKFSAPFWPHDFTMIKVTL